MNELMVMAFVFASVSAGAVITNCPGYHRSNVPAAAIAARHGVNPDLPGIVIGILGGADALKASHPDIDRLVQTDMQALAASGLTVEEFCARHGPVAVENGFAVER